MLTGQEAHSKREVRQDAEPKAIACGDDLRLNSAHQHGVLRLRAHELREVLSGSSPRRVGDLPRRKVGVADVEHLAVAHQVIECSQRLFDWRVGVRAVELVEVDIVGLEPFEAALHALQDALPRAALAVWAVLPVDPELGCYKYRLPLTALIANNAANIVL